MSTGPHGLDGAIDMDGETRAMTVSDGFAKHICDLSNWSVSQKFTDVFPEVRGFIHEVEQGRIPQSKVNVEEFLKRRGIQDPDADIVAVG